MPIPIITLTTDFGDRDGYVGTMKGVILSIAPEVRLIDITHQIEPQNIKQAASLLAEVYPYFPSHTVHLVVVDPGVGSDREPIAVETPRGRFIAPNNGVLTYVMQAEASWKAVRLENSAYWLNVSPSNTFHGRDIFSPAAAHLASGLPLDQLGSALDNLTETHIPDLTISSTLIKGEVMRIDRFGNVLTNIKVLRWVDDHSLELERVNAEHKSTTRLHSGKAQVTVGYYTLDGIHKTYSEVATSQRVAVVGSGGELEIAVNQGNASETMRIKVGDPVSIQIHH